MTKECIESVCAHLTPRAFGVLTFKEHDSFSQPAIPGEEMKINQKSTTTKPHTLKKEPLHNRKWRHQHRNRMIQLKALKFPTKRLLLGTRCRALL